MPEISFVIPVYNEEESLSPLMAEIRQVMDGLQRSYEVIFVNDASNDRTAAILADFRRSWPEEIYIIALEQRSGQTFALRKGLGQVKGDIVITLDADLQNDPADVPRMLAKLEEGFDVVCGWRKSRQDTVLKACLSKLGNILQRQLTGLPIHDVSCTLRVYRRWCVEKIPLNWEGQHRFIPLALSLQGYKVGEVISNHRLRRFGSTKYSHKRIFKVVADFFRILKHGGRQ